MSLVKARPVACALQAPPLYKLIERSKPTEAELALWAAVGTWLGKDPRFGLLHKLYDGPRVALGDLEIAAVLVRHHGEDPRFIVVRELSRQTGCSLGTASQVHRDFSQYESLALVP